MAAALALALASGGRKVLLVEVEGRQGIAQVFDLPPLPYEERKIAVAPGGGDVYALAIDPEEAMLEYLEMFYGMRRAGKALSKMGIVDFATTIAPGFRDVLVTGKTSEAVRREAARTAGGSTTRSCSTRRRPAGSPASSTSPRRSPDWPGSGPIKNHADLVHGVVASPETAVHFVTLLEEMPVQETLDGIAEAARGRAAARRDLHQHGAGVIAARADPGRRRRGPVRPGELALGLKAAGLADGGRAAAPTAEALAEEIADHARRTELERARAASRWRRRPAPLRAAAARRRRGPGRTVRAGRSHPHPGSSVKPTRRHRAPVLDIDADPRRPGHPDHRLLRLRRRRQDHHGGGAGAARGRARPVAPWCSPWTPPGGWRSRWGSPSSTTPRGWSRAWRASGELHAMMLDMKRTFDEIIEAHADPERARQILTNPFYQSLSSSFAGTQEYMAMEKLGPAPPLGRVGSDHRRHPALPLRAGLPRRARSGSAASSTAGSSGC